MGTIIGHNRGVVFVGQECTAFIAIGKDENSGEVSTWKVLAIDASNAISLPFC
jgi:hypothetical protein